MMSLLELLNQTDWTGAVSSASLSAILQETEREVSGATSKAVELDGSMEAMRLLIRSITNRTGRYTSPSAILSGGVVRETAGVVTLPEVRRTNAVRAGDGSLRATVTLAGYVGTVTTTENPNNVLDTDSATAWQIEMESPVIPSLSFPETGVIEAAHMTVQVAFDTPQFLSQMEIGVLGDPALLIRVEDATTGAILWNGKEWVNPGALVFFTNRTQVQAVKIHLLQPHGIYLGRSHVYRTAITAINLMDIEYVTESSVLLPQQPVTSQMLRPLAVGTGDYTLEINLNDTWTVLGNSFMLPKLRQQEEIPVSALGSIFLSHVPDGIDWALVRKQSGQSMAVTVSSIRQAGNALNFPDLQGASNVVVSYRYRPTVVSTRVRLNRTVNAWTSPLLKEVTMG